MVTRFALFNEPDFEYMESYLEDMARQGLLLDRYGTWCAQFNKGEPCQRRYRIVPKIINAVREDEIALYEDAGWHYVGKKEGTGLNIFYTDDPEAPEIFTDMDSFRMYAKKYALVGILSIMCIMICPIIALRNLAELQTGGMLHLIEDMGLFILVPLVLGILLLIAVAESLILSQFSTTYRILAAKPMRHNIEYKSKLKFRKATLIMTIVLVPLLLIGQCFIGYDTSNEATEKSYKGYHPVSYEIIDPEGWSELEFAIVNNDWPEDWHFGVYTKNGMFFDKKVDVHTDIGDTYMRALYGEAKSATIAEKWLEEEIVYDTKSELQPEDIAMETPEGLDYIGFYIDEWEDQILYMRKGNVIERIIYYGDEDILQHVDAFVNDILAD